MRTRLEYKVSGSGIDAATDHKKLHGGRVVTCLNKNNFADDGSGWLERIYWYSHQYTQSDIFNELKFDEISIN